MALVMRLMGNKTVFSRAASERKDLDVLQVLIDLDETFQAPLGLQVDVEIRLGESSQWHHDPSRAQRELGWRAEVSLDEGLCRYADWFQSPEDRGAGPTPLGR